MAGAVRLCRAAGPWAVADDRWIADRLAVVAAFSLWTVMRDMRVSPSLRASLLLGSVAVLVQSQPKPGPIRLQLEAACSDHVLGGVVVLSALAQHRRIPSRIGTVPIAFVPLRLAETSGV